MWDLATLGNWGLILQDKRIAIPVVNPDLPPNKRQFEAIPPLYANPISNTLLIGTFSETAKPYWFLGATATQYLYVSPSSYGNFVGGVQTSVGTKIGLNKLTLLEFKEYNVHPYVLELAIPYWIEDIYVEVWQFGGYDPPNYQDVLDKLNLMDEKIDLIEDYGT